MRFAEFFAGIGLVRMGLERAGWRCVFANDIDASKHQMYRSQFPDADTHFLLGDVRRVSAAHIPEAELATASFPCADLSLAGGRAGLSGAQSSALWPFLEIIGALSRMRPALVMLENVPALITSHGGGDFKSLLAHLNGLGYLVDAFVVDAVRFVPQSRARLFVIGLGPDLARLGQGRPRRARDRLRSEHRPPLLARFIEATLPDIEYSLRDLPPLPARTLALTDILERLPEEAPEWWSHDRTAYLLNQMHPGHRAAAEAMRRAEEETYGTVFRRIRNGRSMAELRADGIAGCLRTPKGGSGRQILLAAGCGRIRARLLTPRECARLMGADGYALGVPPNQALYGFGDAVCVPVIEWIAHNYLNPLMSQAPAGAAARPSGA
jgi:DNA (cytosine-5)-methyltransferase 1